MYEYYFNPLKTFQQLSCTQNNFPFFEHNYNYMYLVKHVLDVM
jgi:hypothetical protein